MLKEKLHKAYSRKLTPRIPVFITGGGKGGEVMGDVSKLLALEGSISQRIIVRVITFVKVEGRDFSNKMKVQNTCY